MLFRRFTEIQIEDIHYLFEYEIFEVFLQFLSSDSEVILEMALKGVFNLCSQMSQILFQKTILNNTAENDSLSQLNLLAQHSNERIRNLAILLLIKIN